jgi:hypothetical protein
MTAINDVPINPNFLSPLNFQFSIKRAPNINFFIQKVNIPGLSLPVIEVVNPLIDIPFPGDHLNFEELNITFKVDEDLQNYLEIYNWIRALGRLNPADYHTLQFNETYLGQSIRSDISLNILTSLRNVNYEIIFIDAFPIKLSNLNFDTTAGDVSFIEASATFRYINYNIISTK